MTNYTGFTSDALSLLVNLTGLAEKKPRYPSGSAAGVWDDLLGVISQTEAPLFDALNQDLANPYNSAVKGVTGWVNNQVINLSRGSDEVNASIIDEILKLIQKLTKAIDDLYNNIVNWFKDLVDGIKDVIDAIGSWIGGLIDHVSDWINDNITATIKAVREFLNNVIQNVRDWIQDTYNNVKNQIVNVIQNAREWIVGVYTGISEWIANLVQGIRDTYDRVKQTIEDLFNRFLDWIQGVRDNIVAWWHGLLNRVADFIDHQLLPFFSKVQDAGKRVYELASTVWGLINSGDYQGALDAIDNYFKGIGMPAPVKTLSAIVSVMAYFWETIHLQFVPLEYNASKQAQISLALEPLDLSTVTQAVYKGLMSEKDLIINASLAGISKDKASKVVDANRPLPTPGQIQASFLRNEIDVKTHDALLSYYGFSGDNIRLIKQLYMLIPGVSDLIRMAVREAFSPEIAEKFGQYQDFPKEFAEWGVKQGLSEEWCKRYWAAHWDLPSATMGFEMLHRGVITNDELVLLLRALDVMPFWREKLIKISYNPLTRVDVRRMYKAGVINEAQVKRTYLDLGYDDQKATWLTEFTKRYYTPDDQTEQDEFRSLARGTYSQAYKRHIISEDEYRKFLTGMGYYIDDANLLIEIDKFAMYQNDKLFDLQGYRKDWQKMVLSAYDRGLLHRNEISPMLTELGYTDDEVELELNLADYNRQLAMRNLIAQQVHDQFVNFIIDVVGLHTILDQFNFTSEEIDRLQEEWNIERIIRTRRPPISDLKRFHANGWISDDDFLDELRGQGYHEKYIDLYARSLAAA